MFVESGFISFFSFVNVKRSNFKYTYTISIDTKLIYWGACKKKQLRSTVLKYHSV